MTGAPGGEGAGRVVVEGRGRKLAIDLHAWFADADVRPAVRDAWDRTWTMVGFGPDALPMGRPLGVEARAVAADMWRLIEKPTICERAACVWLARALEHAAQVHGCPIERVWAVLP